MSKQSDVMIIVKDMLQTFAAGFFEEFSKKMAQDGVKIDRKELKKRFDAALKERVDVLLNDLIVAAPEGINKLLNKDVATDDKQVIAVDLVKKSVVAGLMVLANKAFDKYANKKEVKAKIKKDKK